MLKQKMLSLASQFIIQDNNQQDVFAVKGRLFSLGKKLSFQNMAGQELAFIRQKLFVWPPWISQFDVLQDGQPIARIIRPFALLRRRYQLHVHGVCEYAIQGNFVGYEYQFTRDGRDVASVSKRFWSWTDTYGVEISDDQDDVLILCTAVVIDMMCHNNSKRD